ncbi:MAG: asparagine synthase (glutamine-hydrolyzing) [Salinarimonadaceae bacterium]|nr:MAG: asparagine synthase (glutamine-hydrolyzing) [Salinarimonadaceae bacterium]
MCGIAGLFDSERSGDGDGLRRAARAMGDTLAHRGPDGEGVHVDAQAGLALAHRRLSIVDLSPAGAQPMVSACGRFVLCYNGEIYNAEDMRAHEALAGVAWRGHSDTEVILESVARRGLEPTLADMNGMFAFALWDRETRILSLARDRLGIKPLFIARSGRGILFASEAKALRAAGLEPRIDPEALAAYLRFAYVPAPFSIYEGVEKVLPGEIVTMGPEGGCERRFYWRLADAVAQGRREALDVGDDEAAERLDALLRDAVGRQTISDVPLGAFLSGGIDSSLVAAMMAARGGRVRTFSIGFPDFGFDESSHAAAVARHLGTEHTGLVVTGREALDVVPDLSGIWDEPFADSSQIPTLLLSRLTRAHVTVALSGDGGDELFAGYNRYALAGRHWPRLERVPIGLRSALARLADLVPVAAADALARFVPGAPPQAGDKLRKAASVLPLDADGLYRRLTSQIPDPSEHIHGAERESPFTAPSALGLVDRMRYRDTLTYLPDDILQKVDRASMAASLEARPPLLDHRVVEFAWTLPQRFLLRDGRSKWLLRRVLDRYVPPALIERPKMGFGVPLAEWLRGPLLEWARDAIEAPDYGGGLLRPEPARRLLGEHLRGGRNHAYQLWTLLMFEAWRRRWT